MMNARSGKYSFAFIYTGEAFMKLTTPPNKFKCISLKRKKAIQSFILSFKIYFRKQISTWNLCVYVLSSNPFKLQWGGENFFLRPLDNWVGHRDKQTSFQLINLQVSKSKWGGSITTAICLLSGSWGELLLQRWGGGVLAESGSAKPVAAAGCTSPFLIAP